MEKVRTRRPLDTGFLPRLRFSLPPDAARLLRARERIRDYLQAHSSDTRAIDEVVLAVEEACTNVIRHSGSQDNMAVSLAFQSGDLVAEVSDSGGGFDLTTFDPSVTPDPLLDHGRGLYLICRLTDSLELRLEPGLTVHMVKRGLLNRPPRPELFGDFGDVIVDNEMERLETRRRELLEGIDEAFMALDWEYRVIHANDAALDLLQVERRRLLGRAPWEAEPRLRDDALVRACTEAMELGRPAILEQRALSGGWLEVRVYPTQAGASVYLRDIERRKLVERQRDDLLRELADERARLRDVLEALPVGVSLLDAHGSVLEINDANARVWAGHLPKASSIDEYALYEGFHHGTGAPMLPHEWPAPRVVETGESAEELVDIKRLDGSMGVARIVAVPVRDGAGRLWRIVVLTEDVTEQVRRGS